MGSVSWFVITVFFKIQITIMGQMGKSDKLKGYLFGAIAAATYGMNPLFALPLYSIGMSLVSVLFFRYLFAVVAIAIMIKARGHDFRVPMKALLLLVVMGILFVLSSLTLFGSYKYMDAGIASTILFVYPIMVSIIMTLFFKEKMTFRTVFCLLAAFGGIVLLYKGSDGTTLSSVGIALVLGSALSYAIYIAGMNIELLKSIPTIKVTFYALLSGLVVLGVLSAINGLQVPQGEKWYLWGNLVALGLLPTAVSLLCTTAAIQRIGSTSTAILGALEPLTAVFFGITVFGEKLTLRNVAGLVLVLVSVSIVILGGKLPEFFLRIRKLFPRRKKK